MNSYNLTALLPAHGHRQGCQSAKYCQDLETVSFFQPHSDILKAWIKVLPQRSFRPRKYLRFSPWLYRHISWLGFSSKLEPMKIYANRGHSFCDQSLLPLLDSVVEVCYFMMGVYRPGILNWCRIWSWAEWREMGNFPTKCAHWPSFQTSPRNLLRSLSIHSPAINQSSILFRVSSAVLHNEARSKTSPPRPPSIPPFVSRSNRLHSVDRPQIHYCGRSL